MSSSNNAAASSSSTSHSSPSSSFSLPTYRKTRFSSAPLSDKPSLFPVAANSLDVYNNSLLSRIDPPLGPKLRSPFPELVNSCNGYATRHSRKRSIRRQTRKNMEANVQRQKD